MDSKRIDERAVNAMRRVAAQRDFLFPRTMLDLLIDWSRLKREHEREDGVLKVKQLSDLRRQIEAMNTDDELRRFVQQQASVSECFAVFWFFAETMAELEELGAKPMSLPLARLLQDVDAASARQAAIVGLGVFLKRELGQQPAPHKG